MKNIVIPTAAQTASGRYKVQVVNPKTGAVVHERPWAKNLILNQGLDGLAERSWQASIYYCAAGMGNTPTQLDSGATTAQQTTTTVTTSANFFQNTDVGKLIRWDGGQLATITAYTSPTQVTVSNSASVSAGLFTMYAVNQTGLFNEAQPTVGRPNARSTAFLPGAGNCGTSFVTNTMKMKRTFEFAQEETNRNYAELGFSWSSDAGQNCFSRVLIEGGAVTVQAEFQLRVIYELSVTITPNTPTARTASITGWLNRVATITTNNAGSGGTPGTYPLGVSGGNGSAFAGTYTIGGGGSITAITSTNPGYSYTVAPSLSFPSGGITGAAATANLDAWTQGNEQVCEYGLERVDENGLGSYGAATNEPCNPGASATSEDAAALPTFGQDDSRTRLLNSNNALLTYTQGTYTRDKRATFGVLESNSELIRAISLCGNSPSYGSTSFTYLFNNVQRKLNTHRLTLTWRHTWGRSF